MYNVQNYRPIAIIGDISKIFNSVADISLTDIFILLYQHKLVKGRSTFTHRIFYRKFISETLNDRFCKPDDFKQVDSLYLGFAKAFDSVNHDLLIYKLSKFNLRGSTVQ